MLASHNDVTWHWKQDANEARAKSMTSEVYFDPLPMPLQRQVK